MSVFQLLAAGVESQDERSEAERRAEAHAALTACSGGEECDPEVAYGEAGALQASWESKCGCGELCLVRWEALCLAWALASRLEWHWCFEWLG